MVFWIQTQTRSTLSAIIPFSKYLFTIPTPPPPLPPIFQMACTYDDDSLLRTLFTLSDELLIAVHKYFLTEGYMGELLHRKIHVWLKLFGYLSQSLSRVPSKQYPSIAISPILCILSLKVRVWCVKGYLSFEELSCLIK